MEIQAVVREGKKKTYSGPQKGKKSEFDLISEFREIYSSPPSYTGFNSREVITYYK